MDDLPPEQKALLLRKPYERAGLEDFRWHDLQHTWASWHAQQGTPFSVLQEMGGWEVGGNGAALHAPDGDPLNALCQRLAGVSAL